MWNPAAADAASRHRVSERHWRDDLRGAVHLCRLPAAPLQGKFHDALMQMEQISVIRCHKVLTLVRVQVLRLQMTARSLSHMLNLVLFSD